MTSLCYEAYRKSWKPGGNTRHAILSPKNMLVIEEIRGKSGLCLIVAPRLLLSTKEYSHGSKMSGHGFSSDCLSPWENKFGTIPTDKRQTLQLSRAQFFVLGPYWLYYGSQDVPAHWPDMQRPPTLLMARTIRKIKMGWMIGMEWLEKQGSLESYISTTWIAGTGLMWFRLAV